MSGKTRFSGITPRGKSIQIGFQYKDQRCRENLKMEPTATNLKLASHKRGQILVEIAMGNFNYADHFPDSNFVEKFGGTQVSNMTVSDALDWWWKYNKPAESKTASIHKRNIKRYIKPKLGDVILRELKASQVKEWINKIDLNNSTKNTILTPLRQMFSEAVSEDIINKNIMNQVKHLKRDKIHKNPLTLHEVDKVLSSFKTQEVKSYYQFGIFSGLSTGEQLAIQWGDIDLKKFRLRITQQLWTESP